MSQENDSRGALLALGFGTTVVMWTLGYLLRIPGVSAPPALLAVLLLLLVLGGGYMSGRLREGAWKAGLKTGLLVAALNLLILGSVLGGGSGEPNDVAPSALFWIPGWFVLSALLGAVGGAIGGAKRPVTDGSGEARNWTGAFGLIGAGATFLLLIAGGVVTSAGAGLAVVDWPNSFGYNMFLYPLAKMSGGIYYEHSHRLLGSLVGITTLVLAIHVFRTDRRKWLRGVLVLAVLLVIAQGLLGGMRVTGTPTLSTSAEDMSPSTLLAAYHGVLGQIFFGVMVSIMVFLSSRWKKSGDPVPTDSAGGDRINSIILVLIVLTQITIGAMQRHLDSGLLIHIGVAVIVLGFAVYVGMRVSQIEGDLAAIKKTGIAIVGITTVQFILGFATLLAVGFEPKPGPPSGGEVMIATFHQMIGAVLLAHAVMLMLWCHRLETPKRT